MKPVGMNICKSCGMVSYPKKWQSEEDLKKHYRTSYRNPPNAGNFYTGQRKCHFHNVFLQDVFNDWKKRELKSPVAFEVGAAYGLALKWLKEVYPGIEVNGSELTVSYRRCAWHEFGINLVEDFDQSKKYDFLMSYKVAEHQLDIDKRLYEMANCLKDDGYLYISVPTWFDSMCNFGLPGFDLEYYYSLDHVNVWTVEIFENILKRAGFEIIKKDSLTYDSSYLCKRNINNRSEPLFKHDSEEIKNRLDKIKNAFLCLSENKYEEAIAFWPDYPQSWSMLIEATRKQMFEKGWEHIKTEFIPKMLSNCNNTIHVLVAITDLAMRAKQWEEAIAFAERSLKISPENPTSLQQLMNIMREIALSASSEKEKIHYFEQARNIARHGRLVSTQHFKEFIDHTYLFNSQLPTPSELLV
jgi:SAM-dependent methyltransferase